MAKIAVDLNCALQARSAGGGPGSLTMRTLAQGAGWTVADGICTSGPGDRAFEEQHLDVRVALVLAGTFQYRSRTGSGLMTPGSMLLGNPGDCFECDHAHGTGDRCVSFAYEPGYFERLVSEIGVPSLRTDFPAVRLPPLRTSAPLVARAAMGLLTGQRGESLEVAWHELSIRVATEAVEIARGLPPAAGAAPASTVARVTRAVRAIDREPAARLTLDELAAAAGLSRYHFLRTFEQLTGVTPHQYVLRARLREAATRLAGESASVLDIALDCGFGDVSNFNRAFRAEFGATPRAFRPRRARRA